jgi:hypothetical protein
MENYHASTAQQFQQINQRIKELKTKNRGLNRSLVIFIFLFLLSAGYQLYAEFNEPLFGKWANDIQAKKILEAQQTQLSEQMDSLSRANDLLMENSPYYTGVFFEVQIGAFQHFDLSSYGEALMKFRVETKDELHKYTLGKFRKLDMAEAFRKDMERLGIKDAFVVAKINGERVSIRQAIEKQQKQHEYTL